MKHPSWTNRTTRNHVVGRFRRVDSLHRNLTVGSFVPAEATPGAAARSGGRRQLDLGDAGPASAAGPAAGPVAGSKRRHDPEPAGSARGGKRAAVGKSPTVDEAVDLLFHLGGGKQ